MVVQFVLSQLMVGCVWWQKSIIRGAYLIIFFNDLINPKEILKSFK